MKYEASANKTAKSGRKKAQVQKALASLETGDQEGDGNG